MAQNKTLKLKMARHSPYLAWVASFRFLPVRPLASRVSCETTGNFCISCHLFSVFVLMLLYQEEGTCYSLYGQCRTFLTERRMRRNQKPGYLAYSPSCWRHHVPYHLDCQPWHRNLEIIPSQSSREFSGDMFCRGPDPTLFPDRHLLSTVTRGISSSEMECGTVNTLKDTNLCTKSSMKTCRRRN